MKIVTTFILSFLSIQAVGQVCDLTMIDTNIKLEHVYVFEEPNRTKPEKMDWVVFCLQEPVEEAKRNVTKINSGFNFNDLYGVKVVVEPTSENITEVRLSWHENTIAMISGVLGNVKFNGVTTKNHIKGEVKSLKALTAQKSQLINNEMISENVNWGFAVRLDHDVQQTDSKSAKQ